MLECTTVLQKYGLQINFPYEKVWSVLTPDASSGRAVLLCQSCVVPRTLSFSDCRGNYRDLARFYVFFSRYRLYLSVYIFSECLESDKLPQHWENIKKVIKDHSIPMLCSKINGQRIYEANDPTHFHFDISENNGWPYLKDLYKTLKNVIHTGSQVSQTSSKSNETRFPLIHALSIVTLASSDPLNFEPASVTSNLEARGDITGIFSLRDCQNDLRSGAQSDMVPVYKRRMLKVPSYFVSGETVTIALLLLDSFSARTTDVSVASIENIIFSIVVHAMCRGDAPQQFVASWKRHKSAIVGGILLRLGCWRDRRALVVSEVDDSSKILCYAYLAGGSNQQPHNTYALLFRRLPLGLADRIYALILFLSEAEVDEDLLMFRPKATEMNLAELKSKRKSAVDFQLSNIRMESGGDWSRLSGGLPDDK